MPLARASRMFSQHEACDELACRLAETRRVSRSVRGGRIQTAARSATEHASRLWPMHDGQMQVFLAAAACCKRSDVWPRPAQTFVEQEDPGWRTRTRRRRRAVFAAAETRCRTGQQVGDAEHFGDSRTLRRCWCEGCLMRPNAMLSRTVRWGRGRNPAARSRCCVAGSSRQYRGVEEYFACRDARRPQRHSRKRVFPEPVPSRTKHSSATMVTSSRRKLPIAKVRFCVRIIGRVVLSCRRGEWRRWRPVRRRSSAVRRPGRLPDCRLTAREKLWC